MRRVTHIAANVVLAIALIALVGVLAGAALFGSR